MTKPVKKVPRKLRGREVIFVDQQILAWRALRKENPSLVGKTAKAMQERESRRTALKAELAEIAAKTKKYF